MFTPSLSLSLSNNTHTHPSALSPVYASLPTGGGAYISQNRWILALSPVYASLPTGGGVDTCCIIGSILQHNERRSVDIWKYIYIKYIYRQVQDSQNRWIFALSPVYASLPRGGGVEQMNTRTLPSLRIPSHRGWIGHVLHHRFNLTTQRTALNRYMKIHVYKLHILASTRFTEQMNTRTLPSLRIPSHRGRSGHVLHHRFNLTTQRTALSRYMKI